MLYCGDPRASILEKLYTSGRPFLNRLIPDCDQTLQGFWFQADHSEEGWARAGNFAIPLGLLAEALDRHKARRQALAGLPSATRKLLKECVPVDPNQLSVWNVDYTKNAKSKHAASGNDGLYWKSSAQRVRFLPETAVEAQMLMFKE